MASEPYVKTFCQRLQLSTRSSALHAKLSPLNLRAAAGAVGGAGAERAAGATSAAAAVCDRALRSGGRLIFLDSHAATRLWKTHGDHQASKWLAPTNHEIRLGATRPAPNTLARRLHGNIPVEVVIGQR